MVQQRAGTAARCRDAVGEDFNHSVERGPFEAAIGICSPHQGEEVVVSPVVRRRRGHDLLRQDVEWRFGDGQPVELARPYSPHQRGALEQFVARGGEDAAFGRRAHPMSRPADALEPDRDRARRSDLADQIDRADVDAQLERGRRHHRFQLALLEPLLGVEPQAAGQAAVVRQHGVRSQALAQMVGDALGQAPRIDEDERGAVLADQVGQAVVDLLPHLVAGDRAELVAGHLDGQVHFTAMADVDDHGRRAEELRHLLDRPHRRRKADALGPRAPAGFDQRVEAGQSERQVRAALVVDHGVNFVHDQGSRRAQRLAALLGRQQDVERLGRGDQNVRRPLQHLAALPGGGVPGAQGGANGRQRDAALCRQSCDFGQRNFEVLADVVAQRLERRDVDYFNLVRERAVARGAHQSVQADQKRGQRLAGPGGRGDEHVAARADLRPAERLGLGGAAEPRYEPLPHERVEIAQGHGADPIVARAGSVEIERQLLAVGRAAPDLARLVPDPGQLPGTFARQIEVSAVARLVAEQFVDASGLS